MSGGAGQLQREMSFEPKEQNQAHPKYGIFSELFPTFLFFPGAKHSMPLESQEMPRSTRAAGCCDDQGSEFAGKFCVNGLGEYAFSIFFASALTAILHAAYKSSLSSQNCHTAKHLIFRTQSSNSKDLVPI